ncbi:MAG: cytochrome D1 domain-containing protein [Candidatus Binatia bacterium]
MVVTSTIVVGNAIRGARLAISPDGTLAYLGSPDRDMVSVLDTRTNRVVATIPVPAPASITFTPDGRFAYVVSGQYCSTLAVIDTSTHTVRKTLPLGRESSALTFSHDGMVAYVSGGDDGDLVFKIDVSTHAIVAELPIPSRARSMLPSLDDGLLYIAGSNPYSDYSDDDFNTLTEIDVLDLKAQRVVRTIAMKDVENTGGRVFSDGTFTPDGSRFYAVTDSAVAVIELATSAVVATVPLPLQPVSVVVRADGMQAYAAGQGSDIALVDPSTTTVQAVVGVDGIPTDIRPSPDGQRLYVATDVGLSIIDTTTQRVVQSLIDAEPDDAAVTPDGKSVYVIERTRRTIDVIDTASNTVTATIPALDEPDDRRFPAAVTISADGGLAFASYADSLGHNGFVAMIDTATQGVVERIGFFADDFGEAAAPSRLAVTPDNTSLFVVLASSIVAVVDLPSRRVKAMLRFGNQYSYYPNISDIKASPDGRWVYATSQDGTGAELELIDTTIDALIGAVGLADGGTDSVAVAPDGRFVYVTRQAAYQDGFVSVVDAQARQVVGTIPLSSGQDGYDPRNHAGIAVAADGATAFVTQFFAGELAIIDTAAGNVTGTVPVGNRPRHVVVANVPGAAFSLPTVTSVPTPVSTPLLSPVWTIDGYASTVTVVDSDGATVIDVGTSAKDVAISPDGRFAYIAGSGVVVVDTSTKELVGSIPLNNDLPLYLAFTPDGTLAYVAGETVDGSAFDNGGNGRLDIIDAPTRTLGASISLSGEPTGLAVSGDGRFAYIVLCNYLSDGCSGKLAVVDTTRSLVIREIPLPSGGGPIALSADSSRALIAASQVSVVDLTTGNVLGEVPLLGVWNVEIMTPKTGTLSYVHYRNIWCSDAIVAIDTATMSLSALLSNEPADAQPFALALAPDGSLLYVAASGEIFAMDTASQAIVGRVRFDGTPSRMAVQCRPGECLAVPTAIPRTPLWVVPTLTPTPIPEPNAAFLCAAGSRDGLPCDSAGDCPDGACVFARGVCDGGDYDSEECDCVSSRCVAETPSTTDPSLGTCLDGADAGRSCSLWNQCEGGLGCRAAQRVCLDGIRKGNPCLRDDRCYDSVCVSTGKLCLGGDHDGSACVDDASCDPDGSTGATCADATNHSTVAVVGTVSGVSGQEVAFDVRLGTTRPDVVAIANSITFDPQTPIVTCSANLSLDMASTTFRIDGSRLEARVSGIDPTIADGAVLYTCTVVINAAELGTYPLIISDLTANDGHVVVAGDSGAVVVQGTPPVPTPTPTRTHLTSRTPAPSPTFTTTRTPTASASSTPTPSPTPSATATFTRIALTPVAPPAGRRPIAYVTNSGSDSISVIDTTTNTVTSTISVGEGIRRAGVAFHPDGTLAYLASPGRGAVLLMDVTTSHVVGTIAVSLSPSDVVFAPDGHFAYVISSGGSNPAMTVIDTSSRTVVRTFPVGGPMTFSEDGTTAYMASGDTVYTIDIPTQAIVAALGAGRSIDQLVPASPDLLYATGAGGLTVVNIASRTIVRSIDPPYATGSLRITPNGRFAYVGEAQDAVQAVDIGTGDVVASIPLGRPFSDGTFSSGGHRFYAMTDGAVVVIDVATNTVLATVPLPWPPKSVVMSRDGALVYVTGEGSNLTVINTASNAVKAVIPVGGTPVDVRLSLDGERLYVSTDAGLSIIDATTQRVVQSFVDADPEDAAATPDGKFVYVVERNRRTIDVIDTGSNRVTATVPPLDEPDDRRFPVAVTVSADGSFAFASYADSLGDNGFVAIIDTATHAVVERIAFSADDVGEATAPSRLAVAPDNTALYVVLSGTKVATINLTSRQVTASLRISDGGDLGSIGDIAVSADGRWLQAAVSEGGEECGQLTLIDTATNATAFSIIYSCYGVVNAITVTPDGRLVYINKGEPDTGSQTVSVVDTQSRQLIGEITVEPYGEGGIALTPDARSVYVAQSASNSVARIDTATLAVATTIPVGRQPHHIAIANVPEDTLPPTPMATATPPPLSPLWIIDQDASSVVVVEPGGTTEVDVGAPAKDIVLTPDGRFAYVATDNGPGRSSTVVLIDTATKDVVGSVPLDDRSQRIIFTPDGALAYVGGQLDEDGSGQLDIIDTGTMTLAARLGLSGAPTGLAVSAGGQFVYVVLSRLSPQDNQTTSELAVVDTIRSRVSRELPLPAARGIALGADGDVAFITESAARVAVLSLTTGAILGEIPLPGRAGNEIIVPKTGRMGYVGVDGEYWPYPGQVVVIDSVSMSLLGLLADESSALALSPDEAFLYVATPQGILAVDTPNQSVVARVPISGTPVRIAVQCQPGACPAVPSPVSRTPPAGSDANADAHAYIGRRVPVRRGRPRRPAVPRRQRVSRWRMRPNSGSVHRRPIEGLPLFPVARLRGGCPVQGDAKSLHRRILQGPAMPER